LNRDGFETAYECLPKNGIFEKLNDSFFSFLLRAGSIDLPLISISDPPLSFRELSCLKFVIEFEIFGTIPEF
jgi:hypothetical protein